VFRLDRDPQRDPQEPDPLGRRVAQFGHAVQVAPSLGGWNLHRSDRDLPLTESEVRWPLPCAMCEKNVAGAVVRGSNDQGALIAGESRGHDQREMTLRKRVGPQSQP
jgi:hypothetical protein